MADQSGSTRFQVLFESALQDYKKKTGVTLAKHPLAVELQSCHSIRDITALLQGQAQAFSDFQARDRVMKTIETTVSILTPLSDAASLADAVGLSLFPPAKAIQACLYILLNAANSVLSSCDALADLLKSIEQFVNRLNVYTQISPTPTLDEIIANLIVELISTLALVTGKLKRRRSLKWAKHFFGVKDIRVAQQRLDRLMQEETRTSAAQTLGLVDSLLKEFKDGEQIDLARIRPSIEYGLVLDGKVSTRDVPKFPNQVTSDMNKSKRASLLSDIQRWLSPPDPWKNYHIARGLRHGETGVWFVTSNTLLEWKESGQSSLLWIYGKPGAGKSVLCSAIIEELETKRKSGLASLAIYYCDFREDQKKDLRGLVSSVLFQLCDQSNSYYDTISAFYSAHSDGARSPSDDELVQCLKDLLSLPGQAPIYLIVDGMDECPSTSALSFPRENVLSLLEDITEARYTNLRICVTSRPEADIKAIMEPLTSRSVCLHDECGQKEDIKNYIESFINTNRNMREWSLELRQLVIETLTERADGMFQWARCQLNHLAPCLPGTIQNALNELPDTLNETYERILREINNANWEYARRLLLCVAAASRPLRVDELADILAFDFKALPIPKYREDWRVKSPVKAVLSTCSTLFSLVNVGNSQFVQFSHSSVKEFLTSDYFAAKRDPISARFHISMTAAHILIAQVCLGILLHLDKDITRDSLANFSLAEYAAEHWFEHARVEGVSQDVIEGMKQLFDATKPHFSIWLWVSDPTMSWRPKISVEKPFPPRGTPLHYATFCGLHDVVEALTIENSQDVNSQIFDGNSTPLHLASEQGRVGIARILLEHGADPAVQDFEGSTPLHRASLEGHVEIAQLLLEQGADVTVRDERASTPLYRASFGGNVELARLFIDHGANPAAQDVWKSTPLHRASFEGHVEFSRLLIEYGADAAAQDMRGSTPLHRASERGHMVLAQLLVEHGADPVAQDKEGSTPLHLASSGGHLELITWLLLQHGANATAQDNEGRTPLHRASEWGHVETARFLIEHGADATASDNEALTPLHRASIGGHVELASLLIERGADLLALDLGGSTPLHRASFGNHLELARLLIAHGAYVTANDKGVWTPLHRAALGGGIGVAHLLVEHGANMTARDKRGLTPLDLTSGWGNVELAGLLVKHRADSTPQRWTPLHWAIERGNVELACLLVEHGVDAAAQDREGRTPLHSASKLGYVELARLLVEHGADTAAQDREGRTPLHSASNRGDVELTRLLVEHGADTAAQDREGRTPLHSASNRGDVELARLLLEHGADTAVQDRNGRTPLHSASEWGNVELTSLLLEHGADAAAQDRERWTPLHSASTRSDVELARLLLENGADAAAQDRVGQTPLHSASYQSNVELARLLVEHGADVAAQSERGSTPLLLASRRNCIEIARLLIEHGANTTGKDDDERTPLHWAFFRDNVELARLLIEHGADLAAQDIYGRTPLFWPSPRSRVELAWVFEHGPPIVAHGSSSPEPDTKSLS